MFRVETNSSDTLIYNQPQREETLSEAIEELYDSNNSMYLFWNNEKILLGHKYDLSIIIKDIIWLTNLISHENFNDEIVHWPSSTFNAKWSIKSLNEKIQIEAEWYSIRPIISKEMILNNKIIIEKNKLKDELIKILIAVEKDLKSVGYTKENLNEMKELEDLTNS